MTEADHLNSMERVIHNAEISIGELTTAQKAQVIARLLLDFRPQIADAASRHDEIGDDVFGCLIRTYQEADRLRFQKLAAEHHEHPQAA